MCLINEQDRWKNQAFQGAGALTGQEIEPGFERLIVPDEPSYIDTAALLGEQCEPFAAAKEHFTRTRDVAPS
jgi:hypothetical protein